MNATWAKALGTRPIGDDIQTKIRGSREVRRASSRRSATAEAADFSGAIRLKGEGPAREPCAVPNLPTCGGRIQSAGPKATGRLHAESKKVATAQTPTEAISAKGSLAPFAQRLTIRISGKPNGQ